MNQQNNSSDTAVATTQPRTPVAIGQRGVQIQDLDGLWRFSQYVAKSGLAPKNMQSPEAIFVAIEMGLEVGLPPMAALQNIAVINGRPSIWGDAMLGICRQTGELAVFDEWYEAGGHRLPRNPTAYPDDLTAVCRVQRRGFEPAEVGFSVSDAKGAMLWGKDGPWKQYPGRMLRYRARSFALRDQFGDALKGLRTAEEVSDDPVEKAKPVNAGFVPREKRKQAETKAPEIVETESEKVGDVGENTHDINSPATQESPQTSDPSPDPTSEMSEIQAQFRDFCQDSGIDMRDTLDWLRTTGRFQDADSVSSWSEIPHAVIHGLLTSPKDMAKLVKIHGKVVRA